MAKINKITLDGLEYEIEDSKAQEKLIELESSVTELITEIFWSDLKNLRDNSELVPGMKYRITDYVTTTSQENTVSANHPFDIIVEALNENTLSENAKACPRIGDTYFKDSNLEAWEIKYCLDNDTSRFAWAENITTENYRIKPELINGKLFIEPFTFDGQILIDTTEFVYDNGKESDIIYEWGYETEPNGNNSLYIVKNDVEYESEGIDYNDKHYYRGTITIEDETYDQWEKYEDSTGEYYVSDAGSVYFLTKSIVEEGSLISINKGVIYYMKDEHGNECPYDFKNIQFIRYKLSAPIVGGYSEEWQNRMSENINKMFEGSQLSYLWHGVVSSEDDYYWEDDMSEVISSPTGENKAFFTFSNVIAGVVTDKSKTPNCHSNIIKDFKSNLGLLILNNIVFFSTSVNNYCYSNSFSNNCHSNSFGNSCHYNSFGNDCYSNSFGNSCHYNSFGNNCDFNSFGYNCDFNSFDNDCYYNSFGSNCYNNSFGNSCYYNSFGNNCYSNSFGNNCSYNSFGNNCSYNSLGNYCIFNSFGDNFSYNSFSNYCSNNSFGGYFISNSFGNNCNSNSFSYNCSNNSFGNNCNYNRFGNNCDYNSFGNNCSYNGFFDDGSYVFNDDMWEYLSDAIPLDYVQNNKFGDGCNYLLIYNVGEVGPDESIQNLNIAQGFSSISIDTANGVFYPEVIKIDTVGQDYEIKIARNSKGEVKIYCEADLIG